jgi:hypothetical protein
MSHAILFNEKDGVQTKSFESISKKMWAEMSANQEVALLIENQEDLDEARCFFPALGYKFDFTPINDAAKKIKNYN